MTAALCLIAYALGLAVALRGEVRARQHLARMAQNLREVHDA
ncbi:hypothetical protein [uncultured Desulfovibrio sp.]|nr:hypothetical protein [uncultured Desulfovibrio sp.]